MNTISVPGGLGYAAGHDLSRREDKPGQGSKSVATAPARLHRLWMPQRKSILAERLGLSLVAVAATGSMAYGLSLIPALIQRWPAIESALNRLIQ